LDLFLDLFYSNLSGLFLNWGFFSNWCLVFNFFGHRLDNSYWFFYLFFWFLLNWFLSLNLLLNRLFFLWWLFMYRNLFNDFFDRLWLLVFYLLSRLGLLSGHMFLNNRHLFNLLLWYCFLYSFMFFFDLFTDWMFTLFYEAR